MGYVVAGFQQDFPVVEEDRLVGVLTRNDLAAALGQHQADTPVGDVMQQDFVTADPREMLQTAFGRLQEGHCRTLPVVKDGRLLGLLTADNLAEVLMIQQTLREADRPGLFGGKPGMDEPRDRAGDLGPRQLGPVSIESRPFTSKSGSDRNETTARDRAVFLNKQPHPFPWNRSNRALTSSQPFSYCVRK